MSVIIALVAVATGIVLVVMATNRLLQCLSIEYVRAGGKNRRIIHCGAALIGIAALYLAFAVPSQHEPTVRVGQQVTVLEVYRRLDNQRRTVLVGWMEGRTFHKADIDVATGLENGQQHKLLTGERLVRLANGRFGRLAGKL